MDRDKPMKPIHDECYKCPICGFYMGHTAIRYNYCPHCGQKMDWKEENED